MPPEPSTLRRKALAPVLLAALLCGCQSRIEPPAAAPAPEPINSLALEQCIGENGQAACTQQ